MANIKIKGWVDGIVTTRAPKDIVSVHLFTHKHVPDMVRATTVIGEPVYLESQVRAMLEEFSSNLSGMTEFADEHYTAAARETTANNVRTVRRHLSAIAAKHGITLD
jgi:hypothetical protein